MGNSTVTALRTAQRAHTPVHLELTDGLLLDGVPHSVTCHTARIPGSVWLLTAAGEDVFVRIGRILRATAL